jgi:hypothetical protein
LESKSEMYTLITTGKNTSEVASRRDFGLLYSLR